MSNINQAFTVTATSPSDELAAKQATKLLNLESNVKAYLAHVDTAAQEFLRTGKIPTTGTK